MDKIFLDTPLPFGKFKGELYGDVPRFYRQWLKDNLYYKYEFIDFTYAEYKLLDDKKVQEIWEVDQCDSTGLIVHPLNFYSAEEAIAYLETRYKVNGYKSYLKAIDEIKNKGYKWVSVSPW